MSFAPQTSPGGGQAPALHFCVDYEIQLKVRQVLRDVV